MPAPDYEGLSEHAHAMRRRYDGMRGDLERIEETGYGGRGLVVAGADGTGRLRSLRIDPSLVDSATAVDPLTLADYVLEACNEALDAVVARRMEKVSEVTDGLRDALDGLRSAADVDADVNGAAILAERGLVLKQPLRPTGYQPK